MSANRYIPEHFPIEYDTNWHVLTQEKRSRLKPYVTIEEVNGQEKQISQMGSKDWQPVEARAQETRITETPMGKRLLRTAVFDTADLQAQWDDHYLGEISSPTSPIMQVHGYGYQRLLDTIIVQSALGPATVPVIANGLTTYTTVALPGSQIIDVGYNETNSPANSSLTLEKIRYAQFLFDDNDVPEEEDRVLALCAKELNSLLRKQEVGSTDYMTVHNWIEGKVDKLFGFKLLRVSKRANPAVGGVRVCPAFVKSGICLADSGVKGFLDIRADKSHALQIRSTAAAGGTRTEEIKVVGIRCDTTLP